MASLPPTFDKEPRLSPLSQATSITSATMRTGFPSQVADGPANATLMRKRLGKVPLLIHGGCGSLSSSTTHISLHLEGPGWTVPTATTTLPTSRIIIMVVLRSNGFQLCLRIGLFLSSGALVLHLVLAVAALLGSRQSSIIPLGHPELP